MKKITIIQYTDRWTVGGIEKYLVNQAINLDRTLFQPFILVAQKETDFFDDQLARSGLYVRSLLADICDKPIKRIMGTWKSFYEFMQTEKPEILHLHICQSVGFIYAYLAKKAGVKKVVTHSHNSDCGYGNRFVKIAGHRLCRIIFQKYIDVKLACSDLAGQWLYGRSDFKVVNIPIDIERFKFDEDKRKEMRNKWSVNDEFVVLNVGRMDEQKNQLFLIDLFKEFERMRNAILILIGHGENEAKIRKKIQGYSLEDKVILISQTSEIEKYLWMADVFVLTSLYEGNPVVLVEAQAAGLGCVYSDTITKMAKINENAASVPLNADKKVWINKMIEVNGIEMERIQGYQNVKRKGYSAGQIIHEMQEIYMNAVN